MAYISSDGTVGGRKSLGKAVVDLFSGILSFVLLFFSAMTNPPSQQQRIASSGTSSSSRDGRNNGRPLSSSRRRGNNNNSNIRGLKNLPGTAEARMGGGG